MKLQDVARDLYIVHEWDIPEGFKDKESRDPLNYAAVESQQAKRVKRDPQAIKKIFQACWAQSDSKDSYAQALAEHGYILAKGDRRGFVAVDCKGEIYSVSRWAGVKTKDVRARLGVRDGLPSVDKALRQFNVGSYEFLEESLSKKMTNTARPYWHLQLKAWHWSKCIVLNVKPFKSNVRKKHLNSS